MKLTFLLLFVFLINISASIYSQRFTFDSKETTIKNVLAEIESNSSYKFLYRTDLVDVSRKVSLNIKDEDIAFVLSKIFDENEITYRIFEDNLVVITYKSNLQQQKITGTVTDASNGEPLPGVNILIEGTMLGVITDSDGKYSVEVSSANAVLVFSFVGYNPERVEVGSKTSIDVSLVADITKLEEVVVVGYGTQKKVNLTGSVATVDAEELENRPITQASQALAGLITGVSSLQGSGRPGNDASEIRIRGIGTFSSAGKDPLVLIDGLAASINDVDPNNIKSISVLKDAASAAIYGTRAANGVILIETKRGEKGKLQVNYNNYFGWQKVTELPDFLQSWEYAKYLNQSNQNMDGGVVYTDEQIALFKNGSDPDNYPNVPHLKNLLNSGSGFQTNHNVNFMGGDEKNAYLFSLGYLSQDGVVDQNNYTRYNIGLNFDSQLRENLDLKLTMNGYSQNTDEPRSTGDMQNMIGFAVREAPIYAGRKSDGTYGYQDDFAPEAWMDSESFTNRKAKNFMGGLELSWEFIKGLTLSGKAGYKYYNWTDQWFQSTFVFDASKKVGPNKLSVSSGDNSLLTLQSLLRYTKSLDKHNFTILAGYSQEVYREDWTTAFRDNFPNNSLYELNAGSGSNQQSSGSGLEWALRSYFGRVNYDFDGKYLFEANARYDGTSRFPKDGRWGLFPSVSIGWRLSEESFIKDNASWVDNLKLRASWGKLGNQNIEEIYPYQNVLKTEQNYTLNGVLVSGVALTTLANSGVTWETTTVTDVGFDLSVFRNKLGVTFDYFNKTTSDILYKKSVSTVLGLNVNEYNAGEVKNKGFEIILDYRASIGDLNISVAPNFTYVKNEVTKLAEGKIQDIGQSLFIGESIGAIYGYEADGLFIDANDVTNYPTQPIAGQPGVIRFKDISGPNGVPDGIVNATYDRKVIGSTTPKFYYGANITADFKGFDFSLLLQGMGGYQKLMGSYMAFAFYNSGQIQRWQADNAWTEANPDRNAEYPMLTSLNMGSENVQTNSFWLRNASFLRLKNIQIGYTIPKNITEKIKLTNLRVFVSGQNLFSFNHFYKGWDPEMYQATGDAPSFYPITSIYTLGLNVKF